MTTLKVGTPAVIIPTITERESNARRVALLGAGEVVMPEIDESGEKSIDVTEFSAMVKRVLNEPSYRQSAKRVAKSMQHFGGAQSASEMVEKFTCGR